MSKQQSTDRPPATIPPSLVDDRATKRLLTTWKHAHDRYRICTNRVQWRNSRASVVEKSRRREKWQKVATILDMERTLLRWVGELTQHPDLWTSPLPDSPESRIRRLYRAYRDNGRLSHNLVGDARRRALVRRAAIVTEIRSITRMWMELLFFAVFPDERIPNPIALHPTELFPRKVIVAKRWLDAEVA